MVDIPQEYVDANARFVLVKAREKRAFEPNWESTANYDATSPILQAHIAAGGNYGVLSHNGLCVIDIDDSAEYAKYNSDLARKTLCIMRGTSGRGHIYFLCPDIPDGKRTKIETTFGDVRLGGNFYVVGANCVHPSGDTYNIVNRVPIATIPFAEIAIFFEGAKERTGEPTPFNLPDQIREGTRNDTLFRYGCSLRALGRDASEVNCLIRNANNTLCKPSPIPEDELIILIQSVLKFEKGNVVIPQRPFPAPPRPQPEANANLAIPANYVVVTENQRTGVRTVRLDTAAYAEFLTNYFSIKYFNKVIYIYDHGRHYYRPQTNEINTHVRDTCIEHGVSEKLNLVFKIL